VTDLATLFARDPLSLTQTDISTIVDEMRKSRHAFNAGNMKAGSTKPKTEKQKSLAALAANISIAI
jgi:hypothetical protein